MVSQADAERVKNSSSEPSPNEGLSCNLVQAVAPGRNKKEDSGSRIRTYDLVVNSHPLYR